MTSLFESPTTALIVGGLTTALLITGFLQTGWKSLLVGTLLTIAATIGMVVLERMVVTERERVEQVIYDVAACVERNDVEAAISHVHSGASRIRDHAKREFSSWKFSRVVVKSNLEVKLTPTENPQTAVASFNVVVVLSDASESIKDQHVARMVQVTLRKEQDEWRVWSYTHMNPLGNPDDFSPAVEQ